MGKSIEQLRNKKVSTPEAGGTRRDWPEIELEVQDFVKSLWVMGPKSHRESLEG